jgi:hypothetical protein
MGWLTKIDEYAETATNRKPNLAELEIYTAF